MAEVVALLVLTLALLTALNIAAAMLSARTAGQVLAGLRVEAYVHVQRLGIAFHDSSRQGDLLALMTFEVTNLSQFLTATLASVPAMVLTAIGAMLLLFWLAVNLLRGEATLWTPKMPLTARAEWVNGHPSAILTALEGL